MDYKEELIFMSKYIGMRQDYVQAGGGNTSIKISDEYMLIKSSGILLSDMNYENGYSLVNYKMINDILLNHSYNKEDKEKMIWKSLILGKKASIETYLHSITDKYTIHVHPIVTNIFACQKDGFKILKSLLLIFDNKF